MKEEKESEENSEQDYSDDSENSDKKDTLTDKLRDNPWIASTAVLGILILVFLIYGFGGMTGGAITGRAIGVAESQAGANLDAFLNENTDGAFVEKIENYNSFLYRAIINLDGSQIPVYITRDGEYIVQGLTSLKETSSASPQQSSIPKSDKPKVELFVMTHCPYGTQAEKGFIPAILELGDSIDAEIKFVHYFLHEPENDETPRQVCIREEQNDKFFSYLKCFLKDGDSERCIAEAKVDKSKMENCISSGRAEKYYKEDSELSEGYEVRGSPTLVVNGVQSNAGRSAQAYLDEICRSFNSEPEKCSVSLDSVNPSAGFGYGASSGIANAKC